MSSEIKSGKNRRRPEPAQIRAAYKAADELFDGDKSTEFLGAYVAGELGIQYDEVFDALAATA